MTRQRLVMGTAVLLPAVVLIALLAYGVRRAPRDVETPTLGRPAPTFALTLFDGQTVRLEDFRGKIVVLTFWASWCLPCREEAPALEAAWRSLRDQGVVFLGVNTHDQEARARGFLEEFGITYPNGHDVGAHIAIDYGVWGLPEAYVLDADGRITYKHIGMLSPAVIAARINDARRAVVSPAQGRERYQSTR